MRLARASSIGLAVAILSSLISFRALAEDERGDLHEGDRATIGVRSDGRTQFSLSSDLAAVPIPGQGAKANGSPLELTIGMGPTPGKLNIDRAKVGLLEWSHLHALVFERDRDQGTSLGVQAIGLYLPYRIAGNTASRSWALAHVGGDLGFRWTDTSFGAQHDACGATGTARLRLDENFMITDRLSLRTYQEILATALGGKVDGKAGMLGSVGVGAGAGLYLDVSPSAPTRQVAKTDPGTGEQTFRTMPNPGMRVRWILVDASGRVNFLDSITDEKVLGMVKTGMTLDF